LVDYSALVPEALTTLPHFSVSSAISLPKSAGEPGRTVPPKSASERNHLVALRKEQRIGISQHSTNSLRGKISEDGVDLACAAVLQGQQFGTDGSIGSIGLHSFR
jgi:hypothetical protein